MKKRILKKKQKGKKPKIRWNNEWGGFDYFCPTCHADLDTSLYLEYLRFCSRCGQKIYWGITNDPT